MKDCELILGISGVACAIIKCSSDDEISLMSAIFNQLGDTLATYLTQKQICNSRLNSNDSSTDTNNKNTNDKNADSELPST